MDKTKVEIKEIKIQDPTEINFCKVFISLAMKNNLYYCMFRKDMNKSCLYMTFFYIDDGIIKEYYMPDNVAKIIGTEEIGKYRYVVAKGVSEYDPTYILDRLSMYITNVMYYRYDKVKEIIRTIKNIRGIYENIL